MKIVVCIKQVPDTAEVKLDAQTGTLIRSGLPSIMNPDDKAALATAIRLKQEQGAEVLALSMGPPQADLMMREALAMGADRAVLLCDKAFAGSDTLATSSALAAAISKLDYDLILTGRQAIDGDTAQVGPQVAEHLGIPHISYAESLTLEENGILVERQFEEYSQLQRARFPCLVTALSELAEPDYMNPGAVSRAFREQEVACWGADALPIELERLGLKGSPTQVKKSFPKQGKQGGELFRVSGTEAARLIVEKLQERFILERS